MTKKTRSLIVVAALVVIALMVMILPATALAVPTMINAPTYVSGGNTLYYPWGVILTPGGTFTTDSGYLVTMTVYSVEKGQALTTWAGDDTSFVPGPYTGKVVVSSRLPGAIAYAAPGPPPPPGQPPAPPHMYFTRQALYIGAGGLPDLTRSVTSAISGGTWSAASSSAKNIKIQSTGECFNGLFVADGTYTVSGLKLDFNGNGRSDFVGYGAGVLARGANTTLVLDKATIKSAGVVRTGVVADAGANLIVKNSSITVKDGVLDPSYEPTADTLQMRAVPWVLGLSGNARATNLLGTGTKASYINSTIKAEAWGVLSTDGCMNPYLTLINSRAEITGEDGYGTYVIGNATENFLGATFVVPTYISVVRGGNVYVDDSSKALVAQLNTDLKLGLTAKELSSLPVKKTVLSSDRFGFMFHGGGNIIEIGGGTVFSTGEALFLDKGQQANITVDGARGAKLASHNGVIFQLMDDDDPGAVPPNMTFPNAFIEDDSPAVDDATMDPTVARPAEDAYLTFKNITMNGDIWNGSRGGKPQMFGPGTNSRNLAVTLDNAKLNGRASASWAEHIQTTIQPPYFYGYAVADDYKMLGEVTNTPQAAVNNGLIMSLVNGSKWTIDSTCFLSSLTVQLGSSIVALPGYTVTLYDDSVATPIVAGTTYAGVLELRVTH
jgi:hypothetical protein